LKNVFFLCALSATAPCVTLPPASLQSCVSSVNRFLRISA
jgi:hypothetical protein